MNIHSDHSRTHPHFRMALVRRSSPWSISEDEYPAQAGLPEKLRFFLRYAILAPSACNTQPWLFRVREDGIDVIADRGRALSCLDPQGRELVMSCGAVVAILRTAASYFRYATSIAAFPEFLTPDLVARARVTGTLLPSSADCARFGAIPKRRRNVICFDSTSPSPSLLLALAECVQPFGASLRYVEQPQAKRALVQLIAQADRRQMADPACRAELETWLRDDVELSSDGLPRPRCAPSSLPDFGAPVWSEAIGTREPGDYHAADLRQRAGSPPLLAVLSTRADSPQAWLAAGQALQDAELVARSSGVWLIDFNQPIQVPESRARLRELLNVDGYPQALMRIGYGEESACTPRRPLEEMLLDD
jgi:nitroreductase